MEIGERIKNIRKQKKMTQVELSKKSGVKQATISAIENLHNKPTAATMELIAAALDCTMSELLGETIRTEKSPIIANAARDRVVELLMELTPDECQRLIDFGEGIKAGRK